MELPTRDTANPKRFHSNTAVVRFPRPARYRGKLDIVRWALVITALALVTWQLVAPSREVPLIAERNAAPPIAGQGRITGVARVSDGDTLKINDISIRFHGIDAPEKAQTCHAANGQLWSCGKSATSALTNHISQAAIECQPKGKDQYGRTIAVCYRGSEDLNAWMVAEGWAVAYRQYSSDYIASENAAKDAQKNIWAGQFDMPWDWRRGHRTR